MTHMILHTRLPVKSVFGRTPRLRYERQYRLERTRRLIAAMAGAD